MSLIQVYFGMKLKKDSIFTILRTPDHIMPDENPLENRLGKLLKKIMVERGITGRDIANNINLSEGGISRILSGETRPRVKTLNKIARHVARHSSEEQAIIHAYHGADIVIPEVGAPISLDRLQKYSERLSEEAWAAKNKVIRVMEQRAAQADFRSAIETVIKDCGVHYQKDVAENGAATDFLIELPNGERWAIESRADIHRNLAQNFGFAFLVLERLDPNRVLMVTPFTANVSRPKDMPTEIELSDLNNFSILLHEAGAGKTAKTSKAQRNDKNDANPG